MHRLYLTMKDWVQSVPSPKLSFMVDGSDVHTQALENDPYLPWENRCYIQSIFSKYSLEHLLCVKQRHRITKTKASFLMVCKRPCPSTTNFFLFLLIQTCGKEEQGPGTPRSECAVPGHRREGDPPRFAVKAFQSSHWIPWAMIFTIKAGCQSRRQNLAWISLQPKNNF